MTHQSDPAYSKMISLIGMREVPLITRSIVPDLPPPPSARGNPISQYVLHDTAYRDPVVYTPGGFQMRDIQKKYEEEQRNRSRSRFADFCDCSDSGTKTPSNISKFAEKQEVSAIQKAKQYLKESYPFLEEESYRPERKWSKTSSFVTNKSSMQKESISTKTKSKFAQSVHSPQYKESRNIQLKTLYSPTNKPISIKKYNVYSSISSFNRPRLTEPELSPHELPHHLVTDSPTGKSIESPTKRHLIAAIIKQGEGKTLQETKLDGKTKKRLMQTYGNKDIKELMSPDRINSIKDIPNKYKDLVNWNLTRMYRSIGEKGELRIRPPEMPVHIEISDLNDAVLGSLIVHEPNVKLTRNNTADNIKEFHNYTVQQCSPKMCSSPNVNNSCNTFANLIIDPMNMTTYSKILNSTQDFSTKSLNPDTKYSTSILKPKTKKLLKTKTKSFKNRRYLQKTNTYEARIFQEKYADAKDKQRDLKKLAAKCDKELTMYRLRTTKMEDVNNLFKEKKPDQQENAKRFHTVKKMIFEDNINIVEALNIILSRKKKEPRKPKLDMILKSSDQLMTTTVQREKADAYLSRIFHKSRKANLNANRLNFKAFVKKI